MAAIRLGLLLVAVATAGAFTPARPPQLHRRMAVAAPATLDGFLQSLSTIGTARVIVMRPGPEAILEATVDLSTTSAKSTDMPSGKTLVTLASPDKSFELHLDAGRSAKATLGTSAKTGGPVCRVLDEEGTALATLVFKGDKAEAFESLKAELGEEVVFDGEEEEEEEDEALDALEEEAAAPDALAMLELAGCEPVSGEELEMALIDSGMLIVEGFAPWCGPCEILAPILDYLSFKYSPQGVRVVKFDTDEFPDMADRLGIRSMPTVLFMNDGEVVHRFMGAAPKEHMCALTEWVYFDGPEPESTGG